MGKEGFFTIYRPAISLMMQKETEPRWTARIDESERN